MESLATLEKNYLAHAESAAAAGIELSPVVPLMRTVFVSRDQSLLQRVRGELEQNAANARLQEGERTEDWAIIGEPEDILEKVENKIKPEKVLE